MLERRRIMYEVNETYKNEKKEFQEHSQKYKNQEEVIKETDTKIQENLLMFCKFLTDNQNKKNRAIRRFKEERKIKEENSREIQIENEKIGKLQEHQ